MKRAVILGAVLLCVFAHADERADSLKKADESVAKAAPAAQADPSRPIAHLTPAAYWTNDPNGPFYLDGTYHMFSQHNPYGKDWGHMHWAHYTSQDLVQWKREPIALWPSLSKGEEHCFSGSAVIGPDGQPRFFYTSIGPKTNAGDAAQQWMALGDKSGMHWEKWDKNPVMTLALHGDLKVREWRDPYVWKEGNEYRCVLGGALEGDKGAAFIYSSPNLEQWTYRGILCEEPEPGRKGSWECPNFFKLDGKWVLIISRDGVRYFTGGFDEKTWKFTPEASGNVDLGKQFYALNGMVDPKGRHLLWGWVTGVGGEQWNGCLSLPRELSLDKDGALHSAPARELRSPTRGELLDPSVPFGDHYEVELSMPPSPRGLSGLAISPMEPGKTAEMLGVDWDKKEYVLGALRVPLGDGEARLHAFVDGCVMEVYTGDGRALTAKSPPPALLPAVIQRDAPAPQVTARKLKSIWGK